MPRSSPALWIAAAALWAPFLAFLWLHLITPSDGARLGPLVLQSVDKGLQLVPLTPGGLQPGDLLLAINGESVESLAQALYGPWQAGRGDAFGQTVTYTVERDGQRRDLSITLGPYPLGAILAENWGSIATAIIFQLGMAFIFIKRPAEPVARAMFLTSAAIVSSINWSLGLQVSDLLGKVGFWLYALSTTLAYLLIWAGALHAILLFPTPWPPLARRRWMVVLLYAAPYVAMAIVIVLARGGSALTWAKRVEQSVGYVQGSYVLLALAAAVRSFRSARDPISRAQVRWVMSAFVVAFFFNIALGVIPELVLGYPLLSWDVQALVGLLVPFAMGFAILRYRLFDIDVVLNRTLVYGLLTSVVVGLYVGAVGAFDALVRSDQPLAPVLLVTVLTLFILRPLHAGLQRGANRLVPAPAHMAPPEPPAPAGEIPGSAGVASAPGRALTLARVGWLILAVCTVGLFMAATPARYQQLITVSPAAATTVGQLLPAEAEALSRQGLSVAGYAAFFTTMEAAAAFVFFAVAALIFVVRSQDRLALLASTTLILSALSLPVITALDAGPAAWHELVVVLRAAFVASVPLLLFSFPDGRFVPRWTLWLSIAWLGYTLAVLAWPALQAHMFFARLLRPVDVPLIIWDIAWFGAGVLSQVYRYNRVSTPTQRQQTKWVVFGFVVSTTTVCAGLALLISSPFDPRVTFSVFAWLAGTTLILAGAMSMPLAIGISILRFRLWAIDVIIRRTLVYSVLTAIVVGVYVIAVGSLSELFHASGSFILSLLATGLIAVFFQPLRERVQRAVNRLLYGERDDPYAVLSRLGQRMEAALAPEAVLPALAETIAQALKLPYVAVALGSPGAGEPQIAAAYGLPAGEAMRLPLTYQSECVGELLIAPRGPGESFTPAEQRLLADIAHQAGVAAHAVRLTADLQRSRQRLVSAQEEERRRLRRDLHDGLGPQLASQTLTLTAARQLLQQRPAEADALLAEAIKHAQSAVSDIRRVVYDLRPPALDDLGLAGALRAQAAEYGASGVRFTVSVPETLPPLPAAVEVACYRIAQEALTNVVKHAQAQNCALTLTVEPGAVAGAVALEVADDGRGLPGERRAGVGLGSMRERAAELGGQCTIEPGPAGGTRVLARLPSG